MRTCTYLMVPPRCAASLTFCCTVMCTTRPSFNMAISATKARIMAPTAAAMRSPPSAPSAAASMTLMEVRSTRAWAPLPVAGVSVSGIMIFAIRMPAGAESRLAVTRCPAYCPPPRMPT